MSLRDSSRAPTHPGAVLFLTTEAVIAEKPEKEKVPAGPGGGGDMDF